MARTKNQPFECNVVHETVQIRLIKRRGRGLSGEDYYFVQCDQSECQYVDENKAPCPLRVEMFADEIAKEEEEKRRRRERDELDY